ncbi:phospholipase D-like domain-containing protein [Rhizobium leguminosarum]|uniref:phospholipase D-like domain-containing protein n=1 Tax=Rhizobium leguminosarum TaxID=384 RepID=UPI001C972C0C|nr:phospholipase D-like domain-containing protein [Rhizobium leguminosarum]MBY5523582.1 hypothetical protein [Rhizobium leguminosarum]
MNLFDPPGFLDDLDPAGKEGWSQQVSGWLDAARSGSPSDNDGPRHQFFNPLANPPDADAEVATISWNAFPRQVRINSLSDMQRWRKADSSREVQDEYCEWSLERDLATGKIVKVDFTCEGPEYWEFLASHDPEKVVALYRELVSPAVRREDVFVGGRYQRKNRFNSSTSGGIVHLVQAANTLTAEIELGAAATIRRRRNGQDITDAQALIRCSRYGAPERNSDPFIGEQVNAQARRLADVTLNNPVGLYLHQFNPVGWETPDGSDARDHWRYTRGRDGHFVRATYEVPAGRGFVVGDIKIDGRPIQFGAQIADFITIKLEGLVTRIGQSTVQPFEGCRGEGAAPPAVVAGSVPQTPSRLDGAGGEPAFEEAARRALREALPDSLRHEVEAADADEGAAPPALLPYPRLPETSLVARPVSGRIMAYASPDSTYAVTKKLIDSATTALVIGIYDFSASYMIDHLKRAMRRGVAVSLMLDTNSDEERRVLDQLAALGANCVAAPSSSSGNPIAYFGNAHEKIIVVDGEIVMIQSGNWSENSIPFNEGDGIVVGAFEPGNRDMGLAIESRPLATFFAGLVARDMRLSRGEPPESAPPAVLPEMATPAGDIFFEAAPASIPTRLFSSVTVSPDSPVDVTPVITPENFHPTVASLLRSAKHSIRIEQQYIRGGQPAVEELLQQIRQARAENPELDVRIIVSKKYLDGNQKARFLKAMSDFEFEFDTNFRYLSLRHFVHCHNKLIVVDGRKVLLGSQNWSSTGLLSNREASLLIEQATIGGYFSKLFDADWELSEPGAFPPDFIDPVEAGPRPASEFARGGLVTSTIADYKDV